MTAFKNRENKSILLYILITVGMIAAATGIGWAFRFIGFPETNIVIVYLLFILITARLTRGYVYGIAASVVATCTFNYFFTEPYYSLRAYRPDYPVTFVVMLLVALITSSLTTRLKTANKHLEQRENRLQILYRIIRKLLTEKAFVKTLLKFYLLIQQYWIT